MLNTKNFVEDLKLFALLLTFLAMCVFTVLLGIYDERLLLWLIVVFAVGFASGYTIMFFGGLCAGLFSYYRKRWFR